MNKFIELKNVRENNLKNISLNIPKNKITIFTGVSGSGKSSIVFDTLAQESGRQLNETFNNFIRRFLPKYKRPEAEEINNLSMAIIIDQKRIGGNSRSTLGTISDINPLLRTLFSKFAEPNLPFPVMYSFNDPAGMCALCQGIGKTIALNPKAVIDENKSLKEGAILLPGYGVGTWMSKIYIDSGFFDVNKKIKDYSKEEYEKLMYAQYQKTEAKYANTDTNMSYEGIAVRFLRTNVNTDKETTAKSTELLEKYTYMDICSSCNGSRYNEKVLSSKIENYNIFDLTNMELEELVINLTDLKNENNSSIIETILERVKNLIDVGVGYLTLARETSTLSGGESQRVKMVKHLSSSLTDVTYILDEPSTGLHPHDVHKLNELLIKIRDAGNTVIVVEHDPDVIKIADHIVDVGPMAGVKGGQIMFEGTYDDLLKSDNLTGNFLLKKNEIKKDIRKTKDFLNSNKSSENNLKNISAKIPKNVFTVITGVAGSGKSTLINKVFLESFPKTLVIDQSGLKANKRSNPATFMDILNKIRKNFADSNKVENGYFSFNSKGACPECKGNGSIELNLSFMDATEVPCTVCNGTRFDPKVLQYTLNSKNIVEVMDMTVDEAIDFFEAKDIKNKLLLMQEVGLGYLTLGQPMSTVSGGEGQRLKLARELKTKSNIYILDEPTTGLHLSDVENIIRIINNIVDKGNTVIVIEHNTELIRQADWVIDLGPEGGSKGGEIIFEGTVKDLSLTKKSLTAQYI